MLDDHSPRPYHRPPPDANRQNRCAAADYHIILDDGPEEAHRRGIDGGKQIVGERY